MTARLSVEVDAFASVMWRKILKDPDRPGMPVRRHPEVCVFSCLAAELRSGDIAVSGSDSCANLTTQLMGRPQDQPSVGLVCTGEAHPSVPVQPHGGAAGAGQPVEGRAEDVGHQAGREPPFTTATVRRSGRKGYAV